MILRDANTTKYSKINDNGTIELQNNSKSTSITLKDGTPANTVTVQKIFDEKTLNIDGRLTTTGNIISDGEVEGKSGLKTRNGILTFVKGTNKKAKVRRVRLWQQTRNVNKSLEKKND